MKWNQTGMKPQLPYAARPESRTAGEYPSIGITVRRSAVKDLVS